MLVMLRCCAVADILHSGVSSLHQSRGCSLGCGDQLPTAQEAGHGSLPDTLYVQGPKIEASSGSSCSSSVCSEVGLLKDGAALMLGSHQPRRPAKQAKGQTQGPQQTRSQRSGSGVPQTGSPQ